MLFEFQMKKHYLTVQKNYKRLSEIENKRQIIQKHL